MSFFAKLLAGFAALILAANVAGHGSGSAQPPAPGGPGNTVVQTATMGLLNLNTQYGNAAASARGPLLAQLIAAAHDRHDALAALMETDPAQVLQAALPASLVANFPGQAAAFLEQDTLVDGTLEVYHVDYPDASAEYLYVLNTTTGKLSLHFAGKEPALLTGTTVRVHGVKLDNALALSSDTGSVQTLAPAALPNTLGPQKTLTILVNFTDEATQPYTVTYAQSMMFTTTSNYWNETSYQQTTVVGDVAGWFTIPVSSTTCDYSSIASYAKTAASNAGFVVSNYTRQVYVFPANACTWWGLGSVGGNPSQAWIHSKWGYTLPVVGHEMGHNLGLYHSHSLDCGAVTYATSGCTASEYGDIFDMMGSSNTTPHYNAFQKERLGWLNAGVSPPLTSVGSSGQYTIEPMEKARDTVSRALKIPLSSSCASTQQYYYVESRQASGFDAFLSGNANVLGGVLVHNATIGDANSSYLLDMTAATSSWSDAALDAGLTYTDPVAGLTITPVSVGSSATTVSVTFPPSSCAQAAPTVTATPSGTQWTSDGATVSYSVTVTNNDGCGCPSSTFDISDAVPSGWSATSTRTASIPPGSSTSAGTLVTTAASAPAGFYSVALKASNSAAPTMSSSASGTVAIVTSMGVGVTTDKATYTRPTRGNQTINVAITTTVTNSGSPLAGAAVSVQIKTPSGAISTFSATTSSAGTAVVSYPIKSKATTGNYTVTSTATVGAMSSTATAAFAVK
jgi:hypothetical protein